MSVPLHAASFDEALTAYGYMTGWAGGWIPVRLGAWGPREIIWRQGPDASLADVVRRLNQDHDDDVQLGLPQAKPWTGGVGMASVLWCRVEGPDQLRRARKFRPLPSLVLAEGSSSRRWLVWALRERAGWLELVAANKRIAYHLRAVQRHADPDSLWLPAPGTCVREGRARPVPVRVARLSTEDFTLAQITGRLRDPPVPSWFDDGAVRV